MAQTVSIKYLTDTSAVPAATGYSTPEHLEAYAKAAADGGQWTSIFIRKEFLRRFICDTIYMSLMIKQCSTISKAMYLLSQQFGARGIKTDMTILARRLLERGILEDTGSMAEEVASMAFQCRASAH